MRTKVYHTKSDEKEYSFLKYWLPNVKGAWNITALYDIDELRIKAGDSLIVDADLELQNGDLVMVHAIENEKTTDAFIARITEKDGRVLYQTDHEWSLGAVPLSGYYEIVGVITSLHRKIVE